jgi:hypothetical protein
MVLSLVIPRNPGLVLVVLRSQVDNLGLLSLRVLQDRTAREVLAYASSMVVCMTRRGYSQESLT